MTKYLLFPLKEQSYKKLTQTLESYSTYGGGERLYHIGSSKFYNLDCLVTSLVYIFQPIILSTGKVILFSIFPGRKGTLNCRLSKVL